jgi:hypothetical protein
VGQVARRGLEFNALSLNEKIEHPAGDADRKKFVAGYSACGTAVPAARVRTEKTRR